MKRPYSDPGATRPMNAESVNFTNGMIVTADDLLTAMHYPIALMQSVNKAVFGCGVVCGFDIGPDPRHCEPDGRCNPCDGNSEAAYRSLVVEVGRGTAIDCYGLPIELCEPICIDISPDACGCDPDKGTVCIYIRRGSASEAPRRDCCSPSTGPVACSRQRDHVIVKAFPEGKEPEHACRCERAAPTTQSTATAPTGTRAPAAGSTASEGESAEDGKLEQWKNTVCTCLKDCDPCSCCGDGWVLLGCVDVCKGGIPAAGLADKAAVMGRRRWIKTIECLCHAEPQHVGGRTAGGQAFRSMDADDPELLAMTPRDPKIEQKIEEVVSEPSHRSIFKAYGIRNMGHLLYVLENRQNDLKSLSQFNRSAAKLGEYLQAVREKVSSAQSDQA